MRAKGRLGQRPTGAGGSPESCNGRIARADGRDHSADAVITPEWIEQTKAETLAIHVLADLMPETVADGIEGVNIGRVNGRDVMAVDADAVMLMYDMDFVVAGNHERWPFIPAGEYWVDSQYTPENDAHDCRTRLQKRR